MWAITPSGTGKPAGARRIRADWPLAEGETFTTEMWDETMVLAEDGTSLRTGTADELKPPPDLAVMATLADLDRQSIPALRAFIAAQPGAPQEIKDLEAAAEIERGKLHPKG